MGTEQSLPTQAPKMNELQRLLDLRRHLKKQREELDQKLEQLKEVIVKHDKPERGTHLREKGKQALMLQQRIEEIDDQLREVHHDIRKARKNLGLVNSESGEESDESVQARDAERKQRLIDEETTRERELEAALEKAHENSQRLRQELEQSEQQERNLTRKLEHLRDHVQWTSQKSTRNEDSGSIPQKSILKKSSHKKHEIDQEPLNSHFRESQSESQPAQESDNVSDLEQRRRRRRAKGKEKSRKG
ncbi:hypothetical protein LIA77_03141 [Sarocladium implicatum]|nr:hypothetical protein LIA77_03141 [Sarocladium implicatum]